MTRHISLTEDAELACDAKSLIKLVTEVKTSFKQPLIMCHLHLEVHRTSMPCDVTTVNGSYELRFLCRIRTLQQQQPHVTINETNKQHFWDITEATGRQLSQQQTSQACSICQYVTLSPITINAESCQIASAHSTCMSHQLTCQDTFITGPSVPCSAISHANNAHHGKRLNRVQHSSNIHTVSSNRDECTMHTAWLQVYQLSQSVNTQFTNITSSHKHLLGKTLVNNTTIGYQWQFFTCRPSNVFHVITYPLWRLHNLTWYDRSYDLHVCHFTIVTQWNNQI